MKISRRIYLLCLLALLSSCSGTQENTAISVEEHLAEVESWHGSRVEKVMAEEGWLNIIGLYWLEEGANSVGSGTDNSIRIINDSFPEEIGMFSLVEGTVYFTTKLIGVTVNDEPVESKVLVFDSYTRENKKMAYENFRWNVIKRGDAFGLRIRDLKADAILQFTGIERFPVDLAWRFEARFIPYVPAKEIPITNVLGQTTTNLSPGYVAFDFEGLSYRLDALEEGDELFLIFADNTSGADTYGGGRYIYTRKPDAEGKLVLDFNKAYNPPCVFTPYATCPLPPRENILDLSIIAGEKNFGDH